MTSMDQGEKMARRMLIAGNWKMNGLQAQTEEFTAMMKGIQPAVFAQNDVLICPPATLLAQFAWHSKDHAMQVGGEDCHWEASGAHTGDISAGMIADAGGTYCIVGHSERRADHKETSAMVKAKAEAAIAAGMTAIVCVGETIDERKAGKAVDIVSAQVRESLPDGANAQNCVIAYEPVWAIGTGETATNDDIAQMHGAIRSLLHEIGGDGLAQARILYGGSVKPGNAKEIFGLADVDGGLIGGASLKAVDFCAIANTQD